jgi:hypothetical protein
MLQDGTVNDDHFHFGLLSAEFDQQIYLQTAIYCPVCTPPDVFSLLEQEEGGTIVDGDLIDVVCLCDYRPGEHCGALRSVKKKWKKRCKELREQPGGEEICQNKAKLCEVEVENSTFSGKLYFSFTS